MLTLLSAELRLTPSVCVCVPHAAQPHQLAKHVAKYLVKLQRRRRRRPGNSSALRKSLADAREETSLEKSHEKDFSCNTSFSGYYHTLLEASSSLRSIFPGLALASHSCKTHCPGEVLAAAPGATAASGRGWPPCPVPARHCSGHPFPTARHRCHRPRVVSARVFLPSRVKASRWLSESYS